MARIEVRFGDVTLRDIPLDKPVITIGRSKRNDIVIDNMAVSRRHARIYQEGPRFVVEDLKSLNGTFVNHRKVSHWILSDKDQILIGKHTLTFIEEKDQPASDSVSAPRDYVEETLVLETKKQRELLARIQETGSDKKPEEVRGVIAFISGGSGQHDIELAKRLAVAGKGSHADIKLKGLFLGKAVFLISQQPSGFYISNAGGKLMTRVNGALLTEQQKLNDGDVISAGRTTMQFRTKT